MSKADVAAFEKEVAKQCATWSTDVNEAFEAFAKTFRDHISALAGNIKSMKIPSSMSQEEVEQIPELVGKTIKDKCAIKRGSVELKLTVDLDATKRKFTGYSVGSKAQFWIP